MKRLGLALQVIQDGMRQNTPNIVKTSVGEAVEVLGILFNTHKCLLRCGVEIEKRLESHPTTEKIGIFRRSRSASLEDTPKSQAKDEKRSAPPPPPLKKLLREVRVARHPPMPR